MTVPAPRRDVVRPCGCECSSGGFCGGCGPEGRPAVSAATCRDSRCTGGITACQACHGWGVVNPKGKPYRWGHKGELPTWAVPCQACHGTGLAACGCRPLNATDRAALLGVALAS